MAAGYRRWLSTATLSNMRSTGGVSKGDLRIFDLERGRAVLRSDRGTRWLPPDAVYIGIAALAAPTLDGMP